MDEKNGIIGPKIKNINGSIQSPALKIPSMLTTLFEAFGLYLFLPNTILGYRGRSDIVMDLDVGWVTGACFIIKRQDYDLLKGFDDNYFLYLEDADLCMIIWEKKLYTHLRLVWFILRQKVRKVIAMFQNYQAINQNYITIKNITVFLPI